MTGLGVVGFGALNVDKLFKVERLAHAEEESFVTSQQEVCGGSAANTIVGLARLGVKTGFIGKIAADREGDMHLADFTREGVNTTGIIRSETGHSGNVMGFVDAKGARALYIQSGVNDDIAPEEIKAAYVNQAQFIHLTSFVGDKSFETQKQIVAALPENVKVSFDPGVLYVRKGFEALEFLIKRSYVLMPNSLELEILTGTKNIEKGAAKLLGCGVKIVVVKLGAEGCYVTDGKETHTIAPLKVPVVDTTGAGDAFCAGFLYGLLNQKSLKVCGELGNFVGSQSVTKMGARAGLPYEKDLPPHLTSLV
jgi:ribokinase